jgi:hypothetical protein
MRAAGRCETRGVFGVKALPSSRCGWTFAPSRLPPWSAVLPILYRWKLVKPDQNNGHFRAGDHLKLIVLKAQYVAPFS